MADQPSDPPPPGRLAGVPDWLRPRALVAPVVMAAAPFLVPEHWPSRWLLDLHPALGAVVGAAGSVYVQRMVARQRTRTARRPPESRPAPPAAP
ncbi:MAG: hypothetical protein R3C15_11535 [Thermoleophilia bacterium]